MLDKKFRRKFLIQREGFKQEIQNLDKLVISKRVGYQLEFIFKVVILLYLKENDVEDLFEQFYTDFMEKCISKEEYNHFFISFSKEKIGMRHKGKTMLKILRKSEAFKEFLVLHWDIVKKRQKLKINNYFGNLSSRMKTLFLHNKSFPEVC